MAPGALLVKRGITGARSHFIMFKVFTDTGPLFPALILINGWFEYEWASFILFIASGIGGL
jgi:hypothetical protein